MDLLLLLLLLTSFLFLLFLLIYYHDYSGVKLPCFVFCVLVSSLGARGSVDG
jgi:hypothetical protein